jgi:hypothetical protein
MFIVLTKIPEAKHGHSLKNHLLMQLPRKQYINPIILSLAAPGYSIRNAIERRKGNA